MSLDNEVRNNEDRDNEDSNNEEFYEERNKKLIASGNIYVVSLITDEADTNYIFATYNDGKTERILYEPRKIVINAWGDTLALEMSAFMDYSDDGWEISEDEKRI